MSRPLVFQPGVRDEIDDAYAWYQEQRHGLGEEFLTEVERVLVQIEQNPEMHALIYRALRHSRLKRFPYAVYYRLDADRIVVVALHHNKRDPGHWRSGA